MKELTFKVQSNRRIARGTFRMVLSGDASGAFPGQFVNLRLPGFFLRRPISVCDASEGTVTLVYKTVGHGTEDMSRMEPGTELSVLGFLGNGFDPSRAQDAPLLIGGGAGAAPLYFLAKKLLEDAPDRKVTAVLGFNTEDEVFYADEFAALGVRTFVTLVSRGGGSCGSGSGFTVSQGFVTDAPCMKEDFSYSYACGPLPMLKAIYRSVPCPGEMSFEERMGCGFGACMGCTMETKAGFRRVCKDGPVFRKEELLWQI